VKLGMGLIGTMTAILLGLLIASAKSFYDSQRKEVTDVSAKVVLLDRALAIYGPETKETREVLKRAANRVLQAIWSQDDAANSSTAAPPAGGEMLYEKIELLSPQNDTQRSMRTEALSLAIDLGKTRWLMFEQANSSVSLPLLVVLVFWLTTKFCSFGLLSPRTPVVVATLGLCALSVSAAVFLMVEMYNPFRGVVQVSSAPFRSALANLGK